MRYYRRVGIKAEICFDVAFESESDPSPRGCRPLSAPFWIPASTRKTVSM